MYLDEIKKSEMSITEVISMAINIFKQNIKSIILITLIIFIPINIAGALIPIDEVLNNLKLLMPEGMDYTLLDFTLIQETMTEFTRWTTIYAGLQQFFGALAVMGVAFIVYKFIDGDKINYKVALEESFSRWVPAIWTILLSSIIMIGLCFFIFIPALIFGVYINFMLYVVIIKKQKGTLALSYSFKLIKGRFFRTLGRLIIIFIIQYTINITIILMFGFLPSNLVVSVILSTLNTFVAMFFWVVQTIWFLNYDSVKTVRKGEIQ